MRSKRLQVPNPGTFYLDLLTIDAAINNRTAPMQAQSLLCAKLQEREKLIRERVQYIADRDNKTFDEVWGELLHGTYEGGNGATLDEPND